MNSAVASSAMSAPFSIARRPVAGGRADALTPAQQRAAIGVIVAFHVAAGWGLMQVGEVREAAAQVAPMFVQIIAQEPVLMPPVVQPAPPAPPVPRKVTPTPRPVPKVVPRAPIVAAKPQRPAPATFVAPVAPVMEEIAAPEPEPAPEPAPSPPAPAPTQIPASAVQYLEPPVLEYPRASKRAGETGKTIVRVYIDEAGLPRHVQVSRSSGFSRLDDAAVAAVHKARFRPYTENGRPTAGWAFIPLIFDLEN